MSEQRLNVNLTVEAQEAVAEVQSQTNLKKSDIANRAVVMYSFLLGEVRSGRYGWDLDLSLLADKIHIATHPSLRIPADDRRSLGNSFY